MNEEPHPQVPVGEFTDEEEWQALSAEVARLDEFDAKKDIPRDQATGPLLTFTWVRTVNNGAPNYRLCLRPFFGRLSERSKESLYCPTPETQIYKILHFLAAHHGWSVSDESRAFLHTPIKTRVFAVPPEEYQSPIPGGVWEMTNTVYGLEEAPADFDEHFGKVSKDLCDEFGSRRTYLVGTPYWTLKLEPRKDADTLQMIVDSDWATDKVDRRSTSAGVAQLGGCTIITDCRTQGSRAMSSAEAEGYALESGACEGLSICAVAKRVRVDLKLALHSDITATISQHTKKGLGRMKHVELRFLFSEPRVWM